jgi:hypothetical protein
VLFAGGEHAAMTTVPIAAGAPELFDASSVPMRAT